MKDNLTWFDKNIIPRTKAYKDFVYQMKNTSSEHFFQDGERIFTEKENNFMKILEYRNSKSKITTSYSEQEKLSKSLISKDQYTIYFNEVTNLISKKKDSS